MFRVIDQKSKKTIIVKYSSIFLRSSGRYLHTDRGRIEAEALALNSKLAYGYVPEVYYYDAEMHFLVMEDLIDYRNLRNALIERKTFPNFAEDITTYMSETLIRTTDIILKPDIKKGMVRNFANPEMCKISEALVFTEPYLNYEKSNVLLKDNRFFLEKELYCDARLLLEAAKLKDKFKSKAQALIHADLHTGSIFVKECSTKVIDHEFAFYGPIGYDVGVLIANLIFAWVNAEVNVCVNQANNVFQIWIENTIINVVDLFYCKAMNILKQDATDEMAKAPGFAEWYMQGIMRDAAGFAGMELNRRVIGDAKVRDITGIDDIMKRIKAERICVLCAKRFILQRDKRFNCGNDYITAIRGVAKLSYEK